MSHEHGSVLVVEDDREINQLVGAYAEDLRGLIIARPWTGRPRSKKRGAIRRTR